MTWSGANAGGPRHRAPGYLPSPGIKVPVKGTALGSPSQAAQADLLAPRKVVRLPALQDLVIY